MSGVSSTSRAAATGGRRELAGYLAVSALVLMLIALPAVLAGGSWGPVVAWGLTFAVGVPVLVQASRLRDPRQSLPFMIFSMAFRLTVSFGGGLFVAEQFPSLPRTPFLLWLAAMYFLALTAEIYYMLSLNSWWASGRQATYATRSLNRFQEAGH